MRRSGRLTRRAIGYRKVLGDLRGALIAATAPICSDTIERCQVSGLSGVCAPGRSGVQPTLQPVCDRDRFIVKEFGAE
jgi:hypothetical protein